MADQDVRFQTAVYLDGNRASYVVNQLGECSGQRHLADRVVHRPGCRAVETVGIELDGTPGDIPFVGDWDCGGDATPGLFRQSDTFAHLRKGSSVWIADIRFFFGNPDDVP